MGQHRRTSLSCLRKRHGQADRQAGRECREFVLGVLEVSGVQGDSRGVISVHKIVVGVCHVPGLSTLRSRKLKLPWAEMHELLDAVKACCQVLPLNLDTHERALSLAGLTIRNPFVAA